MVSAADRATDERVTCLRIFADAAGETHMEDVDIALQPRKLFKDNRPPISRVYRDRHIGPSHVHRARVSVRLSKRFRVCAQG